MNQKVSQLFALKPHYRCIPYNANEVEFRFGVWNSDSVSFRDEQETGKLYLVIKALSENKTSVEIAKQLDLKVSAVEGIIDQLLNAGVLVSQDSNPSTEKFYEKVVLLGQGKLLEEIFSQLSLELDCVKKENLEAFQSLLQGQWKGEMDGLEFEKCCSLVQKYQGSLVVMVTENANPLFLSRWNLLARAVGLHWIHVAIDGPMILVGPTFLGKQGACFDCLELRVLMNMRDTESYLKYKKQLALNPSMIESGLGSHLLSHLATAHALVEIYNQFTSGANFTLNRFLGIFAPNMEISYQDVLQLSGCRGCSHSHHREETQLYFDLSVLLEKEKSNMGLLG